jgi:pimeloyl-ACP methyl ester carboxylesterase
MEVMHYGDNRNRLLSYALLEDAAGYEEFPDFAQPALIFHGEHDDVVPVEFSVEFAATHPNVRLEVVNSGHELIDVLDHMGRRAEEFLT